MQLRALLIVAFGPALGFCQFQQETGGAAVQTQAYPDSLSTDNKWTPGFLGDRPAECAIMPRMPRTFVAKRLFWSFFNTIVFEDRHGKEFGFVESWLGDLKNLFGYPGASFWLKAQPTDGDNGLFNLEGPTPGQDGTFQENPLNNQAQGGEQQSNGFLGSFGASVRGNQQHRLAAFMVGNHDPPVGNPFVDQMEIRDCKGAVTVQAQDGLLIFRGATDAQYYQRRTNAENELIIEDLGQPPRQVVRMTMKEPCRPFPPFCAQMGGWNWFIHGYEWEGLIMTNGQSGAVGGIGASMDVQFSSGEAEDMRFLTLYSAYQFSNTRWSPFMNWIWWILFFAPCCCCCYRSWWSCWSLGDMPKVEPSEESQRLMQTKEIEVTKAPEEKRSTGGFMACCSRRGGRGIAAN